MPKEKLKHPYWYSLLILFESQGYFENGLTIPYIIGARLYIEPDLPILSVRELINEFSYSGFFLNVLMCGEFGEYMFRITGETSIYYSKVENWIIQDESFFGFENISDLIPQLTDRYASPIAECKYSRIPGEWVPFSAEDILRIREVMLLR